jgi:hypothetical protein
LPQPPDVEVVVVSAVGQHAGSVGESLLVKERYNRDGFLVWLDVFPSFIVPGVQGIGQGGRVTFILSPNVVGSH